MKNVVKEINNLIDNSKDVTLIKTDKGWAIPQNGVSGTVVIEKSTSELTELLFGKIRISLKDITKLEFTINKTVEFLKANPPQPLKKELERKGMK